MILECNNARCKEGVCAMWPKGNSKPVGMIDPETKKPDGKGCDTYNLYGVKTDPMSLEDLVKRNANLKRVGKEQIKMDYVLGVDGTAQLVQAKKPGPEAQTAAESVTGTQAEEPKPEEPVGVTTKSPGRPRRIR